MKYRIKLAEAIGGPIWEAYIDPSKHPECVDLPDPFTDANDDYAVLEWFRSGHRNDGPQNVTRQQFVDFDRALEDAPEYSCDYEVGDFARAALKEIENERVCVDRRDSDTRDSESDIGAGR